jgi:hypothetical protein
LAIVIGVAVASAGRARLDVAHHRARIAADLVGGNSSRISQHEQALEAGVKLSNIANMRGGAVGRRRKDFASFVAGAFCSYTNDVARTAKTCQAPFEAKTGFAE